MITRDGPRGCRLVVAPGNDVPLVWCEIAVRGGSAGDPTGREGLTRHMAELARRGAGTRTRAELDERLDDLGASLEVSTGRDAVVLHVVCVTSRVDAALELAADVLARPLMDADEHAKLLRETAALLDEYRDDDGTLARRWFDRSYRPGHPYARTALGTEASLAAIDLGEARAGWRRQVVPGNLVVGFAGAIDEAGAERACDRLLAGLPTVESPPLPALVGPPPPAGRRLLLVDKPERTQSQILIGHEAPAYGHEDFPALAVVETLFGGMFSARLMQEIRVKRGWSYGTGCRFGKQRGGHAFQIQLAPAADVTPEALSLAMELFERLVADGPTADELAFAKSYLAGSWPFALATAQDRLRLAVDNEVYGLSADFLARWPQRLAAVELAEARGAIRRWLRPADALTVVVATAPEMSKRLGGLGLGALEVVPYDLY